MHYVCMYSIHKIYCINKGLLNKNEWKNIANYGLENCTKINPQIQYEMKLESNF